MLSKMIKTDLHWSTVTCRSRVSSTKRRFCKFPGRKNSSLSKGKGIWMASDFARTLKAEWQQSNAFKILKKNDVQPRILYTAPIIIRQEGTRDTAQICRASETPPPLLPFSASTGVSTWVKEKTKEEKDIRCPGERQTKKDAPQEQRRRRFPRGCSGARVAAHQPQEASAQAAPAGLRRWARQTAPVGLRRWARQTAPAGLRRWARQQHASVQHTRRDWVRPPEGNENTRSPENRDANWERSKAKRSQDGRRGAVFRASDPDRGTELSRRDASSETRAAAAESPEPALSHTVAISHPRCGESEKRCCASVKNTHRVLIT